MEALKFYDVKARKSFTTDKYVYESRAGRRFAIAQAPSGIKAYRIVAR